MRAGTMRLERLPQTQRERGLALVLVMWIVVVMSLIAGNFLFTMRTEVRVAQNSLAVSRAEAVADAAVHRAVFDLFKFTNQDEVWKRDGQWHEWGYDGASVRVRLLDESGKIDINTASDPLLKGLFQAQGIEEEEALKLVEAMRDWIDPDNVRRQRGAEEPEYQAAGLPYKPANSWFQTTEELQLVLGMTPALFQRISGLITVYSRQPGVNVQIASREVLLAVPGLTAEQVDTYITQRETARAAKQPLPPFPAPGFAAAGLSLAVSVRSEVTLPDGTAFVRDAVVKTYPGDPKRPYAFLSWRDGAISSPASGSTEGSGGTP
jgi:general secretion pathway protein K